MTLTDNKEKIIISKQASERNANLDMAKIIA